MNTYNTKGMTSRDTSNFVQRHSTIRVQRDKGMTALTKDC